MTGGNLPVVNKQKMILLPMTLVIITLLLSSISAYTISRQTLLNQVKKDGFAYVNLLNLKLEDHREHAGQIFE